MKLQSRVKIRLIFVIDFVCIYMDFKNLNEVISFLGQVSLLIQKKPWFPIDSTICQTEAGFSFRILFIRRMQGS